MIKLKNILSEVSKPKAIHVTYIERSGKLYKIKSDGNRMSEDDFKKQFGIEVPYYYDERKLDKISKTFKKDRIKFTYDDTMDVS